MGGEFFEAWKNESYHTHYPHWYFKDMENLASKIRPSIYYHTSLDWLMPVVEKIEIDERFATMIYVNAWDNRGRYYFSIYREMDESKNMRHVFVEVVTNSKIESIWKGVLEFIYYHKNNMIPRTKEDFEKHRKAYKQRTEELQYP